MSVDNNKSSPGVTDLTCLEYTRDKTPGVSSYNAEISFDSIEADHACKLEQTIPKSHNFNYYSVTYYISL